MGIVATYGFLELVGIHGPPMHIDGLDSNQSSTMRASRQGFGLEDVTLTEVTGQASGHQDAKMQAWSFFHLVAALKTSQIYGDGYGC